MNRILLACSLLFAACAGETKAAAPDAAAAAGTFGAACLVVSDASTECNSGVCTGTFDMIGHPVCSQKCTFGMDQTCPAGSTGMKCNMKGYCKP